MKNIVKLLFLIPIYLSSQHVYRGFPDGKELKKGDVIILDGLHSGQSLTRFTDETYKQLDAIVFFINNHKQLEMKIKVHFDFFNDDGFNKKVTSKYKTKMQKYFDKKGCISNYSIEDYGSSKRFITNEDFDKILKKKVNSRIEIKVLKDNTGSD